MQVQVINNFPTAAAFCASIAPGSTIPAFCNLTAAQQTAVLGFSNGTSIPDTASQSFNF